MSWDYEIAILGMGPAGIQAGIHAGRRKHKVIIFGKPYKSALAQAYIENYFGFKEKIKGKALLEIGMEQLKRFEVRILEEDIVKIEPLESGYKLITEKEKEITALSLILALGVKRPKKIFKDEDKFIGKGLSYCIDCDAWFYKEKKVAVIGDGSAAIHGAKLLTNFAKEVYFYPLKDLTEDDKNSLINKNISILEKKPIDIIGKEEVKGLKLEDETILELDGIFIEIGAKGPLELLAPIGIELDPETFSYVKVNRNMETNMEGIFACGDLTGPPLQLAKAVGEGCIAGLSASDYIKRILKD
ncbi:NAD(P)/FAD-dependent oxidoreductase [Thermodesulfobacterium hydrogeniphilum]|uniref:NAD(P)/FAD-dependent oxidoreductase n=1 Tax=Thermodesulfobacterium hydrogeniphilum TaxID=161156 RepID=UPI00056F3BC8|nr:FAD-dependent oxidoreductase [Thermodesulfobacterium hydrogeniphilum]